MNEPEGTPDQDLATIPEGVRGEPGRRIPDKGLLAVLMIAYEQNGIDKNQDELDAELSDLIQGGLRMSVEQAFLDQPRRVTAIALKRALRIVEPETNEPETTMETVARSMIDESIKCGGTRGEYLAAQAQILIQEATKLKLQKMSY
jgi:hypothetical protein